MELRWLVALGRLLSSALLPLGVVKPAHAQHEHPLAGICSQGESRGAGRLKTCEWADHRVRAIRRYPNPTAVRRWPESEYRAPADGHRLNITAHPTNLR